MLRRALNIVFDTFDTEPANNSECVESVQQYLCYYYFPSCNFETGEINPVCDDSCDSLFDNDDCLSLIMLAYQQFMLHEISVIPDESCSQTYRPYANPVSVSDDCEELQG